jgi:mannose/fructose/N-acetylgalactosamine-specific phosphotransferase system component IID
MEFNTSETKYMKAQDRVSKLKKFYGQVFRGLLAIIITGAINYYLNEWFYPWFLWVVFGVSLGICLKAIRLFGANLLFCKNWEERKIRELIDKDSF